MLIRHQATTQWMLLALGLVLVSIVLPASAARGRSQVELQPQPLLVTVTSQEQVSSVPEVTLPSISTDAVELYNTIGSTFLTDTLTHTLYIPVAQRCYGLCGACEYDGHGGTVTITTTSSSCLATKIRIDLYKRATGYGFSLFEVEAYGPDDPEMTNNLLTGGHCCTSSFEGNNPIWGCERAIDGVKSTRWSSDWYEPQWLVIVLPVPKPVKYVVLWWETAYAKEYRVSVLDSDANCP